MPSTLIVGEVIHTNDLSSYSSAATVAKNVPFGFRGVWGDGIASPTATADVIDYINIGVISDATDFGDPDVVTRSGISGGSDGSRGIWGGARSDPTTYIDVIQYVNIMSTGDAKDFGNLTQAREAVAAVSDGSKCLFSGGHTPWLDTQDVVSIGSTGNAAAAGSEASMTAGWKMSVGSDGVRAVYAGGYGGSNIDTITHCVITNLCTAVDVGELTSAGNSGTGMCDGNRGVSCGSGTHNTINYITLARANGDGIDFGNMLTVRSNSSGSGCTNGSRGISAGSDVGGVQDMMEYITIGTSGNAIDFGELTTARQNPGGVSGG